MGGLRQRLDSGDQIIRLVHHEPALMGRQWLAMGAIGGKLAHVAITMLIIECHRLLHKESVALLLLVGYLKVLRFLTRTKHSFMYDICK